MRISRINDFTQARLKLIRKKGIENMKSILTVLICCLSFSLHSQEFSFDLEDSCQKSRPLPCKERYVDEIKIDSLEPNIFAGIVDQLYGKMLLWKELTVEEDRILIKLMNTLDWSSFDNQSDIEIQFPKLLWIEELFRKGYKDVLYCKYSVCNGRGFSPYFIELKVQYLGNPFSCARFYVME